MFTEARGDCAQRLDRTIGQFVQVRPAASVHVFIIGFSRLRSELFGQSWRVISPISSVSAEQGNQGN